MIWASAYHMPCLTHLSPLHIAMLIFTLIKLAVQGTVNTLVYTESDIVYTIHLIPVSLYIFIMFVYVFSVHAEHRTRVRPGIGPAWYSGDQPCLSEAHNVTIPHVTLDSNSLWGCLSCSPVTEHSPSGYLAVVCDELALSVCFRHCCGSLCVSFFFTAGNRYVLCPFTNRIVSTNVHDRSGLKIPKITCGIRLAMSSSVVLSYVTKPEECSMSVQ